MSLCVSKRKKQKARNVTFNLSKGDLDSIFCFERGRGRVESEIWFPIFRDALRFDLLFFKERERESRE